MKKTQILALILGGMLAVQNTAALAMTNSTRDINNYASRLYESAADPAAADTELSHKEKAELLKKYGLVTEELLKDETKTVTYSDAIRALAYFCWYSEDFDPKMSYKEFLTTSVNTGQIEIKDDDTEIPIGILSDLCLLAAGYVTEQFPERTELAVKNGLMTDNDEKDNTITVERFIDILYTTLNLPICVIDGWYVNAATNTAVPSLIILDGGKNEDGTQRELATRLTELQDAETLEAELSMESPVSGDSEKAGEARGTSVSGTRKNELTTEGKIADLQELGIIAEADDLRLNDKISRAEAAKILSAIMGYSDNEPSRGILTFKDMPSSHWAFSYVENAYASGVIDGDDNGFFNPDDNVTYAQMCKMLVCTLGYSGYADNIGGYPHGYINEAMTLGLNKELDGSAADEELSRLDVMLMAYNALDVPLCIIDAYETVETLDGKVMAPVFKIEDGKEGREFFSLRTRLTEKN